MDFAGSTQNPHSFAKPETAWVTHTHLDLSVDFRRKVLHGSVQLSIERYSYVEEIILDFYELVIKKVINCSNNANLNYDIGFPGPYGRPFYIQLPKSTDTKHRTKCKIRIFFETSPHSPALHWLEPAQTADRKHPFLLSNNKLIYARAMFPCQDTPSVKFTYSAQITVPEQFKVIMSADKLHGENSRGERFIYNFIQRCRIPAYGVAIAVGSLRKEKLSQRSNIYAETTFINDSLDTFHSDTMDSLFQVIENLCGSYIWGRYDICVLPPSIGHFEIECPCVTFISPTVLNGDRSLIISSLVQSISQFWAGNLVTCANYNHLWLNKSLSTFIGRKIVCKVLNEERMMSYMINDGLNKMITTYGELKNAGLLKCLLTNLADMSPDDAIRYVPYEWGCTLLGHLEDILGGPSVMEPFLKSYFIKFANKSIKTKDWQDYLFQYFLGKKKLLDDFGWDTYFYSTDIIPNVQEVTALDTELWNIAMKCSISRDNNISGILTLQRHLYDVEKILLIDLLYTFHADLTAEKLIAIEDYYEFDNANDTIRFNWLLLCIKLQWSEKVGAALNFALRYCSPNYACPIFEKLFEWPEEHDEASRAYNKGKEKMLYVTQKELNIILNRTKHLSRLD